MAGGQRIDDHSAWMGKRGKESPLPMGSKMKEMKSAEGAGAVREYQDRDEAIHATQNEGIKKAEARPLKTGYRY